MEKMIPVLYEDTEKLTFFYASWFFEKKIRHIPFDFEKNGFLFLTLTRLEVLISV